MVECLFANQVIVSLNNVAVTYSILFKCFRQIAECERSISPTSFNRNGPTCLYMLALSVYWMVCYQTVPGGAQEEWDSVATRKVPPEQKVDTKYMQVNELRNIASMGTRDNNIPTH